MKTCDVGVFRINRRHSWISEEATVSTQRFIGEAKETHEKKFCNRLQESNTGLDETGAVSTALRLLVLSGYNLNCKDFVECYSRVFQLVA